MNMFFKAESRREVASWLPFACVTGVAFALIFGAVAVPYVRRFHLSLASSAGICSCFVTLLALALLPGFQAGRMLLTRRRARWRDLPVFLSLCVPYLLYALGTGDFRMTALLRVAAVAVTPALLYLTFPPHNPARFGIADAAVGSLLIAVVLAGWLRNIWSVPVNLDFMGRLLLIAVGSIVWTFVRPVPELNYRLQVTRRVLKAAALNFLYFAAIAVPAGFLIGFTGWHPHWRGALPFALNFIEIFLFIALLEEMFFRGFLQSLLTGRLGSDLHAQLIIAPLFGLFHILHAPFPNWRYVALASVAGWFYGEAYRRGGSLLASSLTHALVDTVWRTWFSRS